MSKRTIESDAAPYSKKRVAAWVMWDPGTQPFNSIVITFVFSVYITSSSFGTADHTSQLLAWTTTAAGVAIALLAPLTGHFAERSGRTLGTLRWLTWALALMTGLLFFVKPDASYLHLGLLIFGVGSVVTDVAASLYNAMLHDVARPEKVGLISGIGWGMGYVGGIISLLVIYLAWIKPEVGLFGITHTNGMQIRTSMVFCGIWIFLLTIPTFVVLRDLPKEHRPAKGSHPHRGLGAVAHAYKEIWRVLKDLWARHPYIVIFLIASAIFRDGVNAIFQFGAPIASQTFGFSSSEVMVFGIAANLVAGVTTMLAGYLDDALGPRWVINASLICILICGIGIFFFHDSGKGMFWLLGMVMCMFVGPVQSAARSFLTRVCPEGEQGDVFGLFATTGKAVSFMAPAAFGIFVGLGAAINGGDNNQYWGILGIAVVVVAGLVAMTFVKVPNGVDRRPRTQGAAGAK